jgi:flagellar biosynthesis chaperone FliJ
MAKQEALEYTGAGKGKLMEEVKWLNKLLHQAKTEHESLLDEIGSLRNQVETVTTEKAQILAKYHQDREIFARMIKVGHANQMGGGVNGSS